MFLHQNSHFNKRKKLFIFASVDKKKFEIGNKLKKKFLTYVTFLGLVFAKNTRLEKIKIPESKDEVNGSHDEYFSLFEGPYTQSFPLRKISLRVSSIHEKNRVVCTLRDRFTDMCPTFSEREMLIDSR
jgi:hypothetical protein